MCAVRTISHEGAFRKYFMIELVHHILGGKIIFLASHLLAMFSFVGMWIAAIQKMFFDDGELFISFEYFLASVIATILAVWTAAKTWDRQVTKTAAHREELRALEAKLDKIVELHDRESRK